MGSLSPMCGVKGAWFVSKNVFTSIRYGSSFVAMGVLSP